MITLTGLYVYPVKSARGIALEAADITRMGIRHDRRFMVVDEQGRFITQREHPELARLETAIQGEELQLTFRGVGELRLPLEPTEGAARPVSVWGDEVLALDLGSQAKTFFEHLLGVPASLVYLPEESARVPSERYARSEDRVGFADGYPYLLASTESLTDLNTRIGHILPMNRFRPNLVVSGALAYAEDDWRHIRIGGLGFEVVKPCTRCVMTTTDQASGERMGKEPLKTLADYHRFENQAAFAQNVIARSFGALALGAHVEVD